MNRLLYFLFAALAATALITGVRCAENQTTESNPVTERNQPEQNQVEDEIDDSVVEQILVDRLIKDYLKEEKHLWKVIEKREVDTLQQIYNVHTMFLNLYYGETNAFSNGLYVNPRVVNSIIAINETSHDIAREFFEHRNYSVLSMKAFNGISLDKTFNMICDETINSTNFWANLRNLTEEHSCHMETRSIQSEYQVLLDYYKDLQAASLRTYITAQLSYMILHLHESGNFREQSVVYQERFRQTNAEIRNAFEAKLQSANRYVWTCDPRDLNAVSVEITKFLVGYIDSEVNLNADGSCALTCNDYQNTKQHACRPDTLCSQLKPENRSKIACKGRLRGCYGLEDSLSICPSDGKEGRYKYVKSSTGLKLGDVTTCSHELTSNAWIRWFVKCSNCFCLCDDPTDSERHFSLRDVTSNIKQNRIVTGVSLIKRNGLIQFAVAERELLPFGDTASSNSWDDVWKIAPQFNVSDNSTTEGVDYHTLTYENRSLNLDTIIAPSGSLVTGVRFNRNSAGHLILEVRVTNANMSTGKLFNLEQSVWLSNENGGKHRINTDNLDLPTKATKQVPNFKENTFVRFGPTHKKIDVSQRTVPFIESLRVEPKRPVALAGVGLYYKGQMGFGGFIATRIVVYNFEKLDAKN